MQSLIAPNRCFSCLNNHLGNPLVCHHCLPYLPWHQAPYCLCCGQPSPLNTSHCGHCLTSPPPFDRTIAVFRYQHPIDKLIQRFKFSSQWGLGKPLGQLIADRYTAMGTTIPDLEAIVPVPLHPHRLCQRGYNQALLLANPLSKALKVPILTDLCRRKKHAHTQTALPYSDRAKNVRQGFALRERVVPRHVILVDDVVTTGATIRALSQLLKKNGCIHITVCCLARTCQSEQSTVSLRSKSL